MGILEWPGDGERKWEIYVRLNVYDLFSLKYKAPKLHFTELRKETKS